MRLRATSTGIVFVSILTACSQEQTVEPVVNTTTPIEAQAYWQGTWQAPRQTPYVDVYYNPSVSTYGFVTAFDHANNQWNGVSSKIVMRKVTTYRTGVNSIQVIAGLNPVIPNAWGLHNGYRLDATGQVVDATTDEPWVHSKITLYNERFESLRGYPAYEVRKRQVAVHETGHSLKLAHTNEQYANETTESSIMVGNAYPNSDSFSDVPQPFDKGELRQKWGQ